MGVSVCLSCTHLIICSSIHPSVCSSIHPITCSSIHPIVCSFIHLVIFLSAHSSIHLSTFHPFINHPPFLISPFIVRSSRLLNRGDKKKSPELPEHGIIPKHKKMPCVVWCGVVWCGVVWRGVMGLVFCSVRWLL